MTRSIQQRAEHAVARSLAIVEVIRQRSARHRPSFSLAAVKALLAIALVVAVAAGQQGRSQPPPLPALGAAGATQRAHLLAVADVGSGDAHQQAIADRMADVHRQRPVDLVILAGDNIYPDGDLSRVASTFERPYRALLSAGVPFRAVLGNHDIRTANGDPQLAYPGFGMRGRWYQLRQGPVELFMLDTNMNAAWQHQLPWLKKALAASNAPWKFVVGHHPIYSSGFYGDDPNAIARLTPLFRQYGVNLYINGHEHHYERSRPMEIGRAHV